MSRKKIKQVDAIRQKTLENVIEEFLRHCRLKNLSPRTLEYYEEDLSYFQRSVPVESVREVTREVMEDFIDHEMQKGNRITAINTRLRGLRVFFRFCQEREYMGDIGLKLLKEDETIKEPYTDAELQRLLKQPESDKWTEWRNWAAVNTFLATGIRANTLVNIRICDVDFEHEIIILKKLKNRKQQIILEQFIQDLECPIVSDKVLWPIYKYGLLTKSLEWKYQNEWRLLSLDKMLADKSDYNCSFMPISKVYLGSKMSEDERKKIAKICDNKGIPVACVIPKQDEYIMQECIAPQKCILRNL